VRSPDLSHEHGAVVGFDVGTAGNLIAEHGQIIRDDRVDLVIAPRSAKLFLIGQSIHLGKGFRATRAVGKRAQIEINFQIATRDSGDLHDPSRPAPALLTK
jgi:hypothetical protein